MKNLFYILFFVCPLVKAQHPALPLFNPVVEDYVAQCSTKPSLGTQIAINKGTNRLISTGDWALADGCWLIAQDLEANAKKNIVRPTTSDATGVNTYTWTANQGMNGDGVGGYWNTNSSPSTFAYNYSQNSAYAGIYVNTTNGTAGFRTEFGGDDGATHFNTDIYAYAVALGGAASYCNATGADNSFSATGTGIGYTSTYRTSSANFVLARNTSVLQTKTGTSQTVFNVTYAIGCRHVATTFLNFSTLRVSFVIYGGGLNDANVYAAEEEIRALIGY